MLRRRQQVEHKGMVPVTAATSLLVIGAGPDALSTAALVGERGIDIVVVGRPMDRVVRVARLTHGRVRVLGGPVVRAACGGNLTLAWLPPMVVPQEQRGPPDWQLGQLGPVRTPAMARSGCGQRDLGEVVDRAPCRRRVRRPLGFEPP